MYFPGGIALLAHLPKFVKNNYKDKKEIGQ